MLGGRNVKAVVYARVVGWDQTEALRAQVAAGTAKARELGAETVEVLQDTFGGASLERPAMSRLRDMVRSGDVNLVVAAGPGELSPDAHDLSALESEFQEHHVTLAFVAS